MIFLLVFAILGLLFGAAINALLVSLSTKIVIGRAATFGSAFGAVVVSFILTLVLAFIVFVGATALDAGFDQVDPDALARTAEQFAALELQSNGILVYALGLVPMALCIWGLVVTDRTDVRPRLLSSFVITIVSQILAFLLAVGLGLLVGSFFAQ